MNVLKKMADMGISTREGIFRAEAGSWMNILPTARCHAKNEANRRW
jgi:hypothetical protein